MDAANVEAEWLIACVRPWYAPLQALGSLEPLDDESSIAWIRVSQAPNEASSVRFLEGVTLLALLAHADHTRYRRAVDEIWPSAGKNKGLLSVGIKWVAQEPDDLVALADFASATHLHSPTFSKAVKLMSVISANDNEDEDHPRVSVCIVAERKCEDSEELTQFLKVLLVLVETLPLFLAAGGVEFPVVQLNSLMASSPALAMEGLECVVKMIQLGVSIDSLAELHPECASPANAVKLVEALRTIAAVPAEGSGGQVKALVASDASPVPLLAAVVSSLHQNQTAESFHLRMTVEPPRLPALTREDMMALMSNERDPNRFRASSEDRFLWRLIARSLFSIHAEHRLQTLYLTLPFRGGVAADELVTALWQEEAAASSYCLVPSTSLTATRFHLDDPTKPKPKKKKRRSRTLQPKPIYDSDSPIEVRVLDHAIERDGSEWWCCGLPGWGEALVARADVISLTDEAEWKPTHSSDRHGIPEISIELMSDRSSHGVSTLVVFIGHKTRKLVVKQYQGDEPLDSWCGQVLRQTPMLEELRLYDGSFNRLDVFIESAANGWSRLKRLSIRNVWTFSVDKICSLFQTLADADHPLTTHLQELDVGFWTMDHAIDDFARILFEMLANNRVLQKITFTFRLDASMHECKTRLEAAFAGSLVEKTPIGSGPVAPRCKLAFLGVLRTLYATTVATMDNAVIASIFDFAAPTVTRDLSLHFEIQPTAVHEWDDEGWDNEEGGSEGWDGDEGFDPEGSGWT